MKIYLVGGAVRDKLLGLPIKDRDWVVIGATTKQMLEQHFLQVGKDFPVFIHPKTKEEYALARTERKTGKGYTGFSVQSSPQVTLEQDLQRRDLTINAIAEDKAGELIDPYGGQQDLNNRLLRHVSPAFSEDPLRVLRVARFAARFAHLGFCIAAETETLIQKMVSSDELQHLVTERVWQEMQRALTEKSPHVFFQCLEQCQALSQIFPETAQLYALQKDKTKHQSINYVEHALFVLELASHLSSDPLIRFAAYTNTLVKGLTTDHNKSHPSEQEQTKSQIISTLCRRLKVPNEYRELAKLTVVHHSICHQAQHCTAEQINQLLEQTDAIRRPQRFEQLLVTCTADAQGEIGSQFIPYPQADILRHALSASKMISAKELLAAGFQGEALGAQLKLKRIEAIHSSL